MSTALPVPAVSRTRIAIQLAALSALGPFCIDAYLPSLPDIAHSIGAPLAAVQGTLTAYLVPFALMTLWHGALSDALGRRRVIVGGLAVFFLASVGCALAPSLTWLLAFRVLQGATAGVGMVVGRAIVRDLYDGPSAQKLMALVAIVFAIAPSIAPLVGGWLQHWFGWRAVFAFMAVYTAGLLLYNHLSLPETLAPAKRQPLHPEYLWRAYRGVLTHRTFLTICLSLTAAFTGLFVYVLSAPVFLMQHLHLAETQFLWLFGPLTAGIVLGNTLSARMAGWVPPLRTIAIGCVTMLGAAGANVLLNLLLPPALPWAVLPLFFYMVGMSLTIPSLTLKAIDCFPQQRGLAASCQSFIQSTGSSLTSAAAPLLWGTSLRLSVAQLCSGTVCGLLALLVSQQVGRARGALPANQS